MMMRPRNNRQRVQLHVAEMTNGFQRAFFPFTESRAAIQSLRGKCQRAGCGKIDANILSGAFFHSSAKLRNSFPDDP